MLLWLAGKPALCLALSPLAADPASPALIMCVRVFSASEPVIAPLRKRPP